MGWDIIAIGTNHTLPIDKPIEIARRLSPLIGRTINIGYRNEWSYDKGNNRLCCGDFSWHKIGEVISERKGIQYYLSIENESARQVYSLIKDTQCISFENEMYRELFHDEIFGAPYALYEFEANECQCRDIRIFKSILEFSVNFAGRWFALERLFREPYPSENHKYMDDFRSDIYLQLQATGADCAFYFPDQGFGEWLYEEINKESDEWIAYMKSRQYMKDDDSSQKIFSVQDYLKGNILLGEQENIICFIDDFSDFKD